MTTISDYFKQTKNILTKCLPTASEAEAAAYVIFEDVAGYTRTTIFADGDREITPFVQGKIKEVVDKIVGGEPVQYAVGTALFMGNNFTVNPSVLIPRPETAWLVDRISDDYGKQTDLRVLDIGTGSGCIAISLTRALVFPQVTAVDISRDAFAVAEGNAKKLSASVRFMQLDILSAPVPKTPLYDIIVSNPPYVCEDEKPEMDKRVADYEPGLALFVPDDDPLKFYKAIAAYAEGALVPGGRLYLEINSRYPAEVKQMLAGHGFTDIQTYRDFRGNWRYATAAKPVKQ